MIELKIIVYYIIIYLTYHKIRAYYFIICIRFELRKHPIRIYIRITSAPYSYSTISKPCGLIMLNTFFCFSFRSLRRRPCLPFLATSSPRARPAPPCRRRPLPQIPCPTQLSREGAGRHLPPSRDGEPDVRLRTAAIQVNPVRSSRSFGPIRALCCSNRSICQAKLNRNP
jgi:hypothetical protein